MDEAGNQQQPASMPDWHDGAMGTRIRVALWLVQEVGEGNRFRKQQLRDAMPGVEQIDRRMRDLRPAGWVIQNYRDTVGLGPEELLFKKQGLPVWEPTHRSAGLRVIPQRLRNEVLERDNNRCVRCGILAGELYPDDPGTTARLTMGHVNPHKHGSSATAADLVTECARCNESLKHLTPARLSVEQVWDRVAELGRADRAKVLAWVTAGRREATPVERAASLVFQLPAVHRDEIQKRLAETLAS